MTVAAGPAVARERLRRRLRELRERSGLSSQEVARSMDWSGSKLSRIEKGDVTVQPLEVRALLALYRVSDDAEVLTLTGLARRSRTRQWYSRYRLGGDYQRYVAYESEARRISIWQVLYVPGLLQTPEYARAITALSTGRDPGDEYVEARVELRLDRQRAFQERLGEPDPPHLVAVIDESALRRPIGGHAVMARQLDHLLEQGREPALTLAVAPLDLLRHPGLGGPFELLEFAGAADPDVLFVEAAAGTDDLTLDRGLTAEHKRIVDDLLTVGLTGDEALDFVRGVRNAMVRG
ncbi:helix-turn-helix domain-containing protein [Actinoplanes sp. RD1]|uniref:helix-turn-helix domain-containing protein n=1 Tax=Actinoplanes sp. RD1 TaxID=3064538 RepID=UPI002741750C|nr:helix-turn-helix transcriptional regulator [Actinoplanes sp. RD1]